MVYLDAETMVYAGLGLLRSRHDLTIVTNTMPTAQKCIELNQNVLFAGGNVLNRGLRCEGYFTGQMIEQLYFDVSLLCADGLCGQDGVGVLKSQEIETHRKIIDHSRKNILVLDRTKFDRQSVYKFANLDEFDLLITNPLDPDLRRQIEDKMEILEVEN